MIYLIRLPKTLRTLYIRGVLLFNTILTFKVCIVSNIILYLYCTNQITNLMKLKYKVRNIETGEITNWSLSAILEEINRDRSNQWTDYDSTDWVDGWMEWVDGEFYSILDINGVPLNQL